MEQSISAWITIESKVGHTINWFCWTRRGMNVGQSKINLGLAIWRCLWSIQKILQLNLREKVKSRETILEVTNGRVTTTWNRWHYGWKLKKKKNTQKVCGRKQRFCKSQCNIICHITPSIMCISSNFLEIYVKIDINKI